MVSEEFIIEQCVGDCIDQTYPTGIAVSLDTVNERIPPVFDCPPKISPDPGDSEGGDVANALSNASVQDRQRVT